MEIKNWVLTVSVNRPFMSNTVNLRHYLNGFTQEQAANISAALVAKHGDFVVGVSLSENHTNRD